MEFAHANRAALEELQQVAHGHNAAEEKGLIRSKFQQTLSEREPQEIRLPNESSASVLTTCQFLWISKASVYAST